MTLESNPTETCNAVQNPQNESADMTRPLVVKDEQSQENKSSPSSRVSGLEKEMNGESEPMRLSSGSSADESVPRRIEPVVGNGPKPSNSTRGRGNGNPNVRFSNRRYNEGGRHQNGFNMNGPGPRSYNNQMNMAATVRNGPRNGFVGSPHDFPPLSIPPPIYSHFMHDERKDVLVPFDQSNRRNTSNRSFQDKHQNGFAKQKHYVASGTAARGSIKGQRPMGINNDQFCNSSDSSSGESNNGYQNRNNSRGQRGRRGDGRRSRSQRASSSSGLAHNQNQRSNDPPLQNSPNVNSNVQTTHNSDAIDAKASQSNALSSRNINVPIYGNYYTSGFAHNQRSNDPPLQNSPNVNSNVQTTYNSDAIDAIEPQPNALSSRNINVPIYASGYEGPTMDNDPSTADNNEESITDASTSNGSTTNSIPRNNSIEECYPVEISNKEATYQNSDESKDSQNEKKESKSPQQEFRTELEEEMALAQRMNLPVILNDAKGKKQLNPNAREYEPSERVNDAFGKHFKMTRGVKGNCSFSPENVASNPNYVIRDSGVDENESNSFRTSDFPIASIDRIPPIPRQNAPVQAAAPSIVSPPGQMIPRNQNYFNFNAPFPYTSQYPNQRTPPTPGFDPPPQSTTNGQAPVMTYPYSPNAVNWQNEQVPHNIPHEISPFVRYVHPLMMQPVSQIGPQTGAQVDNQNATPSIYQSVQNIPQLESQTVYHQSTTPTLPHPVYGSPMVTNYPYINEDRLLPHSPQTIHHPYHPNTVTHPHTPITPISGTPGTPNNIPPYYFGPSMIQDTANYGSRPIMSFPTYWATVETDNPNPLADLEPSIFPKIDSMDKNINYVEPSVFPKNDSMDKKISDDSETNDLVRQICDKLIRFVRRQSVSGSERTDAELTDDLSNISRLTSSNASTNESKDGDEKQGDHQRKE